MAFVGEGQLDLLLHIFKLLEAEEGRKEERDIDYLSCTHTPTHTHIHYV